MKNKFEASWHKKIKEHFENGMLMEDIAKLYNVDKKEIQKSLINFFPKFFSRTQGIFIGSKKEAYYDFNYKFEKYSYKTLSNNEKLIFNRLKENDIL